MEDLPGVCLREYTVGMSPALRGLLGLVLCCLLLSPACADPVRSVLFRTNPVGADIFLVNGSQATRLGQTGQSVFVPLGEDPNTPLHFRFELDGYQAKKLDIGAAYLTDPYPTTGLPPLTLAQSGWGGSLTAHMGGIAVGVVLLLAGVGALLWWRSVRRLKAQTVAPRASPPPPKHVVRIGTTLGQYRVGQPLGQGGTSEVYLGEHVRERYQVAIKVTELRQLEDPDVEAARFRREVAVLGKLQHKNIVALYDSGEDEGVVYLVQELVSGGHLGEHIPSEGLDFRAFWRLYEPILQALRHAHGMGVVHRDVKPENVLLTETDEPKVTDFGLARINDGQRLTVSHFIGTPLYMAPEQYAGKPATPLSDQYSLGVMAYEMLSGRMPFVGESAKELFLARKQPVLPLTTASIHPLPPGLDATVLRMLAPLPENRFPGLDAVLQAFERIARSV